MNSSSSKPIRFAAVGDLLMTSPLDGNTPGRGLEALSDEIRDLFKACDVVFANLECTLQGHETIATEPIVVSSEKQVRSLKNSGINIVSVGNNHAFDCFEEGFNNLVDLLAEMEIPWCGAGLNLKEALRPSVLEVNGLSLAFLGVVDESSGSFSFASESISGVAPLETERVCQVIKELKQSVDHVIVSPHWGMERFRIPSLEQIKQVKAFVDAGASMVLGHHPHVLQGMKIYQGAPVQYSLGNFFANSVYWSNGEHLTWNRFEQTGCILCADVTATRISNVKQIPVFDDGHTVSIDRSGRGDHYLKKVSTLLQKGITQRQYDREKFYVQVLKPIMGQLKWYKLKRIRPSYFTKLLKLISN